MVHANRLHYDPKTKPRKAAAGPRTTWRALTHVVATVAKFTALFAVAACALSYLMYGNLTFNYALPSVARIRAKFQPELVFTPEQLKQFDGTDPDKPIYLAVMGEVFDVTAGREYYGPGGGYHFFAGRDAGRAFVTGCFQTHLTPDLRGLTSEQLKGIDEWRDFYSGSDKYFRVGKVIHPPIDPSTPIPPPCDDDEDGGAAQTGGSKPVGSSD